jgi:hypothetical protein
MAEKAKLPLGLPSKPGSGRNTTFKIRRGFTLLLGHYAGDLIAAPMWRDDALNERGCAFGRGH